jgi:TonB family protein
MRILLISLLLLFLTLQVRAQNPAQAIHFKCPITRELLLTLDWPRVTTSTIPAYPAIAAAKRISGLVRVVVDISPKGTVTAARVITGDKLLREAAKKAAFRWIFEPTENGAHSIPLNFIFRDVDYVASKRKPECGSSPYETEILWRASP